MEASVNYTADLIIQYSLVGFALLGAFGWILWKLFKKNKNQESGSCCGCGLADTCNKKNHGNHKNLQQQHCGKPNTKDN